MNVLDPNLETRLKESIRKVPDFPKEGITFYDITTLLKEAELFSEVISHFTERHKQSKLDILVAVEARGLILGAALAYSLGLGFIPVRKPGKLPADVNQKSYALEYGNDTVEIHSDAISKGSKVLIVDDLLATGGTASGTIELVEELGGEVVECCFLIELTGLAGRNKFPAINTYSMLTFDY